MARDRQRAKQRQAERRARRLEQEQAEGPSAAPRRPVPLDDPTTVEPSPAVDPNLAAGAPPQDEGRSDTLLRDDETLDELDEDVDPELVMDAEEAAALASVDAEGDGGGQAEAYAPRGRRGRDETAGRPTVGRGRVLQFLSAVVAELKRVQWPNRQALTTLTGVVLGFVLIAGGYLGLLDAVFSRVIKAIL